MIPGLLFVCALTAILYFAQFFLHMRADLAPTNNRGGFLADLKAPLEAALHDAEYCAFNISFLKFKSHLHHLLHP